MSKIQLTLPTQLTLKNIEDFFYLNRNLIFDNDQLLIDFSEVDYLEIGSFIYVISLVFYSKKSNKHVAIKLPKSLNIRNIFRIWRFPIVLKEITGIPFKDIVVEEDLVYFGENKTLKGDYYKILGTDEEGVNKLMEKGFFSLTNIIFNSPDNKRDGLINETKKWEDAFIRAVLMKHLKCYDNKTENLLPRIIIYECLTNAYRHPNADSLIAGSFFNKVGKTFTITYWDNGDSILNTIKQPIIEGKNIKAQFDENRFRNLFSSFYVKYITDSKTKVFVINSNSIPDKTSEDHLMLLSTFFPGISRDPQGQNSYFQNSEIDVKSPGMGLTYLLKVVLDKFDGTLSIRTNEYFLNFSKSNRELNAEIEKEEIYFENKYKCKIQFIPNSDFYFIGNMITIRLPLN